MAALTPAAFAGVRVAGPRCRAARASPRGGAVRVRASAGGFIKVLTVEELKAKNGRAVVEVNGKQVLLQELDGVTYAVRGRLGGRPCVLLTRCFRAQVSNKCSHLNLSMQARSGRAAQGVGFC